MNYIDKPEKILNLSFASCFYSSGKWYTLHKNGIGYYSYLVDGRSVYQEAKRKGLLTEYNNLKG
jgi:hypothetical protein